jgi:hypothetical protein
VEFCQRYWIVGEAAPQHLSVLGGTLLENSLFDFMQSVRKWPTEYWNTGISE